ncbi:MAG: hypothetical protein JW969_05950 [Spirochaetales bacterium]|nr:hypothetical protein [Spirochaetales bacterium]
MTTLSKLKTMDDGEIQDWLRKAEKEGISTLVYALLGADNGVKNCVFRNMSEYAAGRLKAHLLKFSKKKVSESLIKVSSEKLERLIES